jgi:hypothetical protein
VSCSNSSRDRYSPYHGNENRRRRTLRQLGVVVNQSGLGSTPICGRCSVTSEFSSAVPVDGAGGICWRKRASLPAPASAQAWQHRRLASSNRRVADETLTVSALTFASWRNGSARIRRRGITVLLAARLTSNLPVRPVLLIMARPSIFERRFVMIYIGRPSPSSRGLVESGMAPPPP